MSRLAIAACVLSGVLSTPALAEADLASALANTKMSADLRAFYFDRNFDKPGMANATAFTAGGIAKLETGNFRGLQVGLAYYGNYLLGLTDRQKASGTSLLENPSNDDISFLGEAYAKFSLDQSSIQIGRQRLATPLANDRDLRLLPTSYQAVVIRSKAVADTHLESGWITGSSEFAATANRFSDSSALWGKDGLAYVYVENNSVKPLKLRAQYAQALETNGIAVRDYRYVDARFSLTKDSYIEAQYAANDYQTAKDATMYGLMAGVNFQYADVALVYNKIKDNAFRAINAGPMYTDWQQGYANYEPSEAIGGYVVLKPTPDLAIKLGSVAVSAQQYSTKDDYIENMIDATLLINKANRVRLRYSVKNLSDRAYAANPTYPDRTDLRLIYSYSFSN